MVLYIVLGIIAFCTVSIIFCVCKIAGMNSEAEQAINEANKAIKHHIDVDIFI